MLFGGLALLIVSGELLVRGSVSIAERLRVSPLIIGMTIVAFGTSAPELIVSLQAAIADNSEIAIGNVVGSNIVNISFILGLSALLSPLTVAKSTTRIDLPILIGASLLFVFASINGVIGRIEGIIGLILLFAVIYFQIKSTPQTAIKERPQKASGYISVSIVMIILSCFGLSKGADFLIDSASSIASDLGVSQRIIGVTIVAIGTSLPELVTSTIAAIKKESDIAIGNIVGSNIFNILCIIGLSATIEPIRLSWNDFRTDYIVMTLLPIVLLVLCKSHKLSRTSGIILIVLYIAYIILILTKP